jgi:hypothetical protein
MIYAPASAQLLDLLAALRQSEPGRSQTSSKVVTFPKKR